MNPRNTIIAILATLSAALALADDFKTIKGKEYKDAKVTRVEPDGIVVKTKSGISKVYFVELPEDVQRRFNYGPQQATSFSAQQATAYSAIQKDQEQAKGQSQGTTPLGQPLLNEQQAAANTGTAGQGQRPTPFPRHAHRYTTVLHQLPQPTTSEAAKAPTTSNNPVHHAQAPATHPKLHEQKTDKQPRPNGT
jgi:hypothetical protein